MVKMGTAATKKEALMAWVSLRPRKKKARFRVTPVKAARLSIGKSRFLIFNLEKMIDAKINEAKLILIKAREKTGTSCRVSFIIGAVAPQMMAAVAVRRKALLIVTESFD